MSKDFTKLAALIAIAAVVIPSMAFAHGDDKTSRDGGSSIRTMVKDRDDVKAWTTNEFGVRVLGTNTNTNLNANVETDEDSIKAEAKAKHENRRENKSNNGLHLGQFKHGFIANLFYNGTVTATSDNGFTIVAKDGTTFTIDADSAKIVSVPRNAITLSDIKVGDVVHVNGQLTDNNVDANVVFVMPANLKAAIAEGTVTAVNDDSITLQTKEDGTTITVNTTDDTKITNEDGETVAQSEIETGVKAEIKGFWDSVKNVFNAIKIQLS
jgi:hypothetical protein